MNTIEKKKISLAFTLSFIGGFVDTLGFVALFGLFTAHVTGNFVLIGSALSSSHQGVLIKFLVFPAFVVGVILTRLVTMTLERKKLHPAKTILFIEALLMIGFMVAGLCALPLKNSDTNLAQIAGMLAAVSMGIQNAASRLVFTHLSPTTVMTGNVTQLIIDVFDLIRGIRDSAIRSRITKFSWPIAAFAIGAICGGMGYVHASFWALSFPILILLTLSCLDLSWAE